MEAVFEAINSVFSFVTPVSDFLWDFPTNLSWYASIPLLGNFSLAIILLVGTGIFLTFKFGFRYIDFEHLWVFRVERHVQSATG